MVPTAVFVSLDDGGEGGSESEATEIDVVVAKRIRMHGPWVKAIIVALLLAVVGLTVGLVLRDGGDPDNPPISFPTEPPYPDIGGTEPTSHDIVGDDGPGISVAFFLCSSSYICSV